MTQQRNNDKYRNTLVAVLDPPPEGYESGQARITIPEHSPETYALDGYRVLDSDLPPSQRVGAAIAEARITLNKRSKHKPPRRGYALGRHFVLVVERRGEHDATIWSYSTSNGMW